MKIFLSVFTFITFTLWACCVEAARADKNMPKVKGKEKEKTFRIESEDKEVTEEQQKLYNQTVKRLARLGAKSQTAQIIALAEEIEYYREKIQRMEAPSE